MNILDQYFNLQNQIYQYFDYSEDWIVYPISDCREYYWMVIDDLDVQFNTTQEGVMENYYSYEIYQDCFLPKSIYQGKDFTMVLVDTHTDGNKFLCIFSNNKRISNIDDLDI